MVGHKNHFHIIVGQIEVMGNVPCLTCGNGNDCQMSAVPFLFGEDATADPERCTAVEDQKELWETATALGEGIGRTLRR